MTVPDITTVRLKGTAAPHRPLLLLGPSLGTGVRALWGRCAELLDDSYDALGWELPGHGDGQPWHEPFSMAELAAGVLAAVDRVLADRGEPGSAFVYAGDSIGGAVGLQLALDHPRRLTALTLIATGAIIGDRDSWLSRAALVRQQGTAVVLEMSAQRWFAPGFLDRDRATGSALLQVLREADDESYARVCEALADFDVRDRLGAVTTPTTAVAGAQDLPTPPASLQYIVDHVHDGRFVLLGESAHLPPAEVPGQVADILRRRRPTVDSVGTAGLAVRRAVLGDAHVDRAAEQTTDLTRDFQDLITQYAWGSIWTRPGLDRRSRSLITLTALVAHGHAEELAMHLRAARTNGLSDDEITECLLQTAVYCGVPAANTAFRIADEVLREPRESRNRDAPETGA